MIYAGKGLIQLREKWTVYKAYYQFYMVLIVLTTVQIDKFIMQIFYSIIFNSSLICYKKWNWEKIKFLSV